MHPIEKDYFRKRIPATMKELQKKLYVPYFFETAAEAKSFILGQINPGETVGIGGSVTLRESLQIVEEIRKNGNAVYDHWEDGGNRARRLELKRKHREVDVFLSGINAVTWDGVMVNLDGGGNRVASLCSGPKRVIAVGGVNKIADSIDSAVYRIRNKTAVNRAMDKNLRTPCVETGICSDCISPDRACAALLILLKRPDDIENFTVVLVNEEMGY